MSIMERSTHDVWYKTWPFSKSTDLEFIFLIDRYYQGDADMMGKKELCTEYEAFFEAT